MKTNFLSTMMILLFLAITGCSKEDVTKSPESGLEVANVSAPGLCNDNRSWPSATGTISGVISSNTTLTDDRVWFIDGPTFVAPGTTLTIQPNTLIKGRSNPTDGSASFLVITRDAQLIADGQSASTSIVFTSDQSAGNRSAGDWGGVILLGNAPVNQSNPEIEGILEEDIPDGMSINYGGTDSTDTSGSLRYIRIEYAGRDLGGGNEINGLTLGGVGNGTTLEYIQVSYGLDDAFEFFGGTVNANNLIAYGNADDDFDFDQGYQGAIQFGVSRKVAGVPFSGDPNGIESDNDATGSSASPVTQPQLSNFTILGIEGSSAAGPTLYGNRWRRNSSFVIKNSIIAGYDDAGVFFDGTSNKMSASGNSYFSYNLVHSYNTPVITPTSATSQPKYGNVILNSSNPNFMNLVNPYADCPDYRNRGGAVNGTNYSNLPSSFTTVSYKGAFGLVTASSWDDNWASYFPDSNPY